DVRHQVLGSRIGRKVASWSVAAALAGGYLLLIVAVQGIFVGAARPRAFVVSLGAALVLSGALLAMGMSRHRDQTLQSARLAVLDIANDGGGWQQESVSYIGADDLQLSLQAAGERGMIRPALAEAANPPAIRQHPFGVENAAAHA